MEQQSNTGASGAPQSIHKLSTSSSVLGELSTSPATVQNVDAQLGQQQLQGNSQTGPTGSNSKIVDEFQFLLEKSQQLFAGLRDLPAYGPQKQWQSYFQKTFEVYTKLWKFQQQHRTLLENKDIYGLKRWEIGEIASKIGQLYYHYYLRTGETGYLQEAFVFYEAIRERNYFKDVTESKNPAMMIKKLRYYARFIVVSFLINRVQHVKKIIHELTSNVEEYIRVYKANDAQEWLQVIQEIVAFTDAEKHPIPIDYDGQFLPVQARLAQNTSKHPSLNEERSEQSKLGTADAGLRIVEAVIIGTHNNEIKFSELTVDMFRILQVLEREPLSGKSVMSTDEKKGIEEKASAKRCNPHKYLLYKPTLSQILVYLSSSFKELGDNDAMLVYISAEPAKPSSEQSLKFENFCGGVYPGKKPADTSQIMSATLHPGDLISYLRKPLFVIVESENSTSFGNIPRVFQKPLVCLMSPTTLPASLKQSLPAGHVYSLFLYSPIVGFMTIYGVKEIGPEAWKNCQSVMQQIENSITTQFFSFKNLDQSVKMFLDDDFSRQFLIRHVICVAVFMQHKELKQKEFLPSSDPPLPADLFDSSVLQSQLQLLLKTAGK